MRSVRVLHANAQISEPLRVWLPLPCLLDSVVRTICILPLNRAANPSSSLSICESLFPFGLARSCCPCPACMGCLSRWFDPTLRRHRCPWHAAAALESRVRCVRCRVATVSCCAGPQQLFERDTSTAGKARASFLLPFKQWIHAKFSASTRIYSLIISSKMVPLQVVIHNMVLDNHGMTASRLHNLWKEIL